MSWSWLVDYILNSIQLKVVMSPDSWFPQNYPWILARVISQKTITFNRKTKNLHNKLKIQFQHNASVCSTCCRTWSCVHLGAEWPCTLQSLIPNKFAPAAYSGWAAPAAAAPHLSEPDDKQVCPWVSIPEDIKPGSLSYRWEEQLAGSRLHRLPAFSSSHSVFLSIFPMAACLPSAHLVGLLVPPSTLPRWQISI